jgi:hypothetical protein
MNQTTEDRSAILRELIHRKARRLSLEVVRAMEDSGREYYSRNGERNRNSRPAPRRRDEVATGSGQ